MLAASAALILAALLPGLPRADDAAPRPLVVLEEQEPQTSWPMLARTMSELRLGELLFDRLFVSRTGGSPVSRVFDEGWRTHGQDLVVAVREGMRFSDGSPVSFSDVAFTLNDVYRRAETGHLAAPWYARVLGDAKQSSPATGKIRFQVSMPERGAERYLVTTALLSQHALKAEAEGVDLAGAERRPIGTGPFHAAVPIADFDDITLQRNPHRLRDRSPEPGEVEAVRLLYDQDAARQRELMEGGRADVWVSPPPAVLPVFRADRERFGVRSYHLNQWWYVALSTGDGHLANPVVREALDLAIPRRQLVDKLGAESAQLTSGPFLPDSAWAPPDLSPTPEDPAGTRRLMEEAGYVLAGGRWTRDGAPVELRLGVEAGISDDFNDVLYGLVEAWEDAGFRIRVRAIGPSAWVQQVEAGQAGERWDLVLGRWNLDREEAALELFRAPSSDQPGLNLFGWVSERTEQTLRDFYAEPSGPRREALMQGLHRHLQAERPYLFLWSLQTRSVYRKDRITGFKAAPFYFYSRFDRIRWKETSGP